MPTLKSLLNRTATVVVLLVVCFVLLWPNFAMQELLVVFNDSRRVANGERAPISQEEINDFIKDRENGLLFIFPKARCEMVELPDHEPGRHCILKARFITTARVNALVQTFPGLLDEYHTRTLPHPVEEIIGRDLNIKLGLDLQGGMRAVFQADFETYQERALEKYGDTIEALREQIAVTDDQGEVASMEQRIEDMESQINLTDAAKLELLQSAKTVIDKRLAAQNLTEPEVRAQEDSYSVGVDMPGAANSAEVLAHIRDTVRVEYRMVEDESTEKLKLAPGYADTLSRIYEMYGRGGRVDEELVEDMLRELAIEAELPEEDQDRVFISWETPRGKTEMLPQDLLVLGKPELDGEDMSDASANVDPDRSGYMITFVLTATGADLFCDLTRESIGRRMAILWGDRVVSAPNINGAICGGNGVITGDFTQSDAAEVANVIKEGALPIDLSVISVSFVGPSLGQRSIITGVISIALGFLVVIAFMVGYYRAAGLVAVMALFMNLVIMTAIMSLMGFTLTLPGFAGVILTVGMAVDANVIIFEKMKEDIRAGKSPAVSVEGGFQSSLWTIVDANITTLIAAVILGSQGDGPIRGFAIVLFFGLLTSIFTALFASRVVFDWALFTGRVRRLSIGWGLYKKEGQS